MGKSFPFLLKEKLMKDKIQYNNTNNFISNCLQQKKDKHNIIYNHENEIVHDILLSERSYKED